MAVILRNMGATCITLLIGLAGLPVFASQESGSAGLASTYVANQLTSANAATPVDEPRPPRARFSLRAPGNAQAGDPITVEIVRHSNDGRAYDFRLDFEPRDLMRDPPPEVSIADTDASWKGAVATVDDPPGEGPYQLRIILMPGDTGPEIGVPRMVEVTVTEKPKPATFLVRAPGDAVRRGAGVTFTVERQGGSGQQRIPYNVTQGDQLVATGEVLFDEKGSPQDFAFADYVVCGDPLSFELLGATGETTATAAFTSDWPPVCESRPPTIWELADEWWPWWAIPLLLPLGWLGWRIVRRLFPPLRNGRPFPPGELHGGFKMNSGKSSFPGGEPHVRMPEIATRFGMALGKSGCPSPLPLREIVDD